MKTLTTHCLFAVAALVAAAGSASAQNYKAEIPMAFRAGNKVMEPGSYDLKVVSQYTGHDYILIYNRTTASTAMLLPISGPDAPKAWTKAGNPLISFTCAGHACTLSRFWDGRDSATYEFPAHKLPKAEVDRVAIVTVAVTKAD